MSADPITIFKGEFSFLSNMAPCQVVFEGMTFGCLEQAYQAAKTLVMAERVRIQSCRDGYDAKRKGKRLTLRSDWLEVRLAIMLQLVRDKFERNPELADLLLATGDRHLEEGYAYNMFWGTIDGVGENHLGRILMLVRAEIRERRRVAVKCLSVFLKPMRDPDAHRDGDPGGALHA
jgi:hypothetical protein